MDHDTCDFSDALRELITEFLNKQNVDIFQIVGCLELHQKTLLDSLQEYSEELDEIEEDDIDFGDQWKQGTEYEDGIQLDPE